MFAHVMFLAVDPEDQASKKYSLAVQPILSLIALSCKCDRWKIWGCFAE